MSPSQAAPAALRSVLRRSAGRRLQLQPPGVHHSLAPLRQTPRCLSGASRLGHLCKKRRYPGPLYLPVGAPGPFRFPIGCVQPVRRQSTQTPRDPVLISLRSGGGRDENKPSGAEPSRAAPTESYPRNTRGFFLCGFHNKSVVVERLFKRLTGFKIVKFKPKEYIFIYIYILHIFTQLS